MFEGDVEEAVVACISDLDSQPRQLSRCGSAVIMPLLMCAHDEEPEADFGLSLGDKVFERNPAGLAHPLERVFKLRRVGPRRAFARRLWSRVR